MFRTIIRSAAAIGVIAIGITGAAAQNPPVGGKGQGAQTGVNGASTQGQIGSSGGGAVSTETVTGAGTGPSATINDRPAGTTVTPANPQATVGAETTTKQSQ